MTIPRGPRDQSELEARSDVQLFTTSVLEEPLEITGRVTAKIWVSSDAPDTDFAAKLTDVYPDGRSILICDGICRARYRDSLVEPRLLEPGKVYAVNIDLWSTSVVLNKGHRLRLAISSSNAPRFEPNPNTAGGPESDELPQTAENTIHFGKTCPSAVILPIRE